MRTNIIENEFDRLLDKLRDFGIDPVAFLAARVEQLKAEQENEGRHEQTAS